MVDFYVLPAPTPKFSASPSNSLVLKPHTTSSIGSTKLHHHTYLRTRHDLVVRHLRLSLKMPKWEDIRDDLFEAIMQVQPAINKEQQMEIVAAMRARGHDMGWNAIRYVHLNQLILSCCCYPSKCGTPGSMAGNSASSTTFAVLLEFLSCVLFPTSPPRHFIAPTTPTRNLPAFTLESLLLFTSRLACTWKNKPTRKQWVANALSRTGTLRLTKPFCWPSLSTCGPAEATGVLWWPLCARRASLLLRAL